jgi:hypothetical protein
MSIQSDFEKWWASTNNANYFHDGAPAHMLKQVAMESFIAGRQPLPPACGGPGASHEGGEGCADCRDEIKVTVKGGFAILEDKDLMAIANRIRSQFEGWRKGPNLPPADPKRVILDTMVMRVDQNGYAVLSDADVDRIAKATVAHSFALKSQALQDRLREQKRQFEDEMKLRREMDVEEVARGVRVPGTHSPSVAKDPEPGLIIYKSGDMVFEKHYTPEKRWHWVRVEKLEDKVTTTALGILKKRAANERVDVAIRDSEGAIGNAMKRSSPDADTYFKFEHVIAALRNLVAAVKILKEQV